MEQEERRQEQEGRGLQLRATLGRLGHFIIHVLQMAMDSENEATDFQYYLRWGPFGSWEENFPISDSHFSHTSTEKEGVWVFGVSSDSFFEVFSASQTLTVTVTVTCHSQYGVNCDKTSGGQEEGCAWLMSH